VLVGIAGGIEVLDFLAVHEIDEGCPIRGKWN